MAVSKVKLWFSRTGKGVPQVDLLTQDGKPLMETVDGEEVRARGNEQYQADQLTDDSVDHSSADVLTAEALEACGGDLEMFARSFREGWNAITRKETGQKDPYLRAADGILKIMHSNPTTFPAYKGLSADQIAELLKTANA
jgi:hypothetical protein